MAGARALAASSGEAMVDERPARRLSLPPTRLSAVFGGLGLLPFWAPLALAVAAPAYAGWALGVQAVYAGLILSFLGGARFGRAVDAPGGGAVVALSMLPSIIALAALALPLNHAAAHLLLAGALVVAWLWDLSSDDLSRRYKLLRTVLTLLAATALAVGAAMLWARSKA